MRVFHRQIITLVALATATAVFLNGTKIGLRGLGSGNGLLSDTTYFRSLDGEYNGLLFGTKKSWDSMSMYLNLTSAYELEKNQGLVNAYGQAAHSARLSELAQNAVASWQAHQINIHGKFFQNEIDDALGLQALRRKKGAVMYAGLFLAVYTGRTLRYNVGDGFSFESRTRMNSSQLGSQYLGWKSNALEASLGATYSTGNQPSAVNFKKKISNDVSVTYEASDQQAVGVSFSKGF